MNLVVEPEQRSADEAIAVLIEHMPASTLARFLAAWQIGRGDYVGARHKLFEGETVESLFEKARQLESARPTAE